MENPELEAVLAQLQRGLDRLADVFAPPAAVDDAVASRAALAERRPGRGFALAGDSAGRGVHPKTSGN